MSTTSTAPEGGFGARVAERVALRESQLLVGLDPDPSALWPGSWDAADAAASPAAQAAAAVTVHCRNVIDVVGPAVVGVKLQVACFERLGAPGWAALSSACAHARAAGLLVLVDGKRGDIDVSAAAYAEGMFAGLATQAGAVPGLLADAVTVSPYMGRDTLAPFVGAARSVGGGVFVLVRTSNPGAADLEDALLAGDRPVWETVATWVAEIGGDSPGLADVGAVIGATAPAQLERARELLPRAIFLLPGVGAQGGSVTDLAAAFVPGRAGGLITVSRGIVGAGTAARSAAEQLREAAWALGTG